MRTRRFYPAAQVKTRFSANHTMIVPALSMWTKHPLAGPGSYPVTSEQGVIACVVTDGSTSEQGVITAIVCEESKSQQGPITAIVTGQTDFNIRLINQDTKLTVHGTPITHEEVTHS